MTEEKTRKKVEAWIKDPGTALASFLETSAVERAATRALKPRGTYVSYCLSLINTFQDYLVQECNLTSIFDAREHHLRDFLDETLESANKRRQAAADTRRKKKATEEAAAAALLNKPIPEKRIRPVRAVPNKPAAEKRALARASRVRWIYLKLLHRIYLSVGMVENPANSIIKAAVGKAFPGDCIDPSAAPQSPGKSKTGHPLRETGSDEPMTFLTPDQVSRFVLTLQAEPPPLGSAPREEQESYIRVRAIIMLMLFGGLKTTHVIGLYPRNVFHRDRDLLVLPKGQTVAPLVVELSPALTDGADGWHSPKITDERAISAIKKWIELRESQLAKRREDVNGDILLFPGKGPKRPKPGKKYPTQAKLNVATVYRWVSAAMAKAGLSDEVAHSGCRTLRNTWILSGLHAGVELEEMKNMLGLKDERSMVWYENAYKNLYKPAAAG